MTAPFGKLCDGTFTDVELNSTFFSYGSNILTALFNVLVTSCLRAERIVTF